MSSQSNILWQVESEISPAEMVVRLKKPIRHLESALTTDCPVCGAVAWLTPSSLVCNSTSCTFSSGGPVEILAAHENTRTAEAVRRLPVLFPKIKPTRDLEVAATQRRQLLEFFLRHSTTDANPGDEAQLLEATASWGQHLSRNLTFFILSPKRATALNKLLMTMGCRGELHTDEPSLVFPYFDKYHSVSALFCVSRDMRKTKIIHVHEAPLSWSGLLNSAPGGSVVISADPVSAVRRGAYLSVVSPEHHSVGLLVGSGTCEDMVGMSHAIYMFDEEGSLPQALALKDLEGVKFASSDTQALETGGISWLDYVFERISKGQSGNASPSLAIQTFLQIVQLGHAERHILEFRLREAGLHKIAALLAKMASVVIHRGKSFTIKELDTGYQMDDKNSGVTPVSNFTLTLTGTSLYPDLLEISHSAILKFAGKTVPISVSIADLDSPSKMQQRVQAALISSGGGTPTRLPVIQDRGAFKYVLGHLVRSTADLTTVHGLSSLGWQDSAKYNSPNWVVTPDGTSTGPFPYHPDRLLGIYFGSPDATAPSGFENPPAGAADLARLILAGCWRAFNHAPVKGMPLEYSGEANLLLRQVFGKLGQKRPITPVGVIPSHIGKHPVYGFDFTQGAVRNSDLFMFGLCDHGFVLSGLDMDWIENWSVPFGAWLDSAMRTLAEHLLSDPVAMPRTRKAVYCNELLLEGEALLGILGIQGWNTAPTACGILEEILEAVGDASHVGRVFAYDYARQKTSIHYSRLETPVDVGMLESELRTLAGGVECWPDRLDVDSPQLHSLLENWFGTDVRIPESLHT